MKKTATPQIAPLAGMTPLGIKPACSDLSEEAIHGCKCGHDVTCHDCETGKCYYKDENGKCDCTHFDNSQPDKATARPWQVDKKYGNTLLDSNGEYLGDISGEHIQQSKLNAALIVKAVNEHAALEKVAALATHYLITLDDKDAQNLTEALADVVMLREGKAVQS